MPRSGVYQLVNLWKGEIVLLASLVEVLKIDAYPPLDVLLWDHHHISKPLWIVDPLDKLCLEHAIYFL